ncbi:CU044_5270 family protein [Streptomyces hoynatensis]|uniref:CU044_5270 family protein n=1 Tax=Streptomyces hoynatensis TaxID=1141874 RepID=A0A3A9ZBB0_9ACTN|nr:CU044_5270 family protein [Streptomyces hoynatensis]RKN45568.1 hypothetical protein D7294_03550 [Streptomyces hoynatensis]
MNETSSLPERDLPADRHGQLREHLLREIRQSLAQEESPSRGRRWLRPAVAIPATAGVLTLAVLAGVVLTPESRGGGESGRPIGGDGTATYAFAPHVNADTTGGAAELLDRIATATARSAPVEDIRDDQFVYVRKRVSSMGEENGVATPVPLHDLEWWQSVDGTRPGLIREPGGVSEEERPTGPDPAPGERGYEFSTNYRHLQTLPTDPEAMLEWLHATVVADGMSEDSNLDQDTFVLIGDLLRDSLMPPEVGAALYRAAARIPDVVVVPDAVNAAGVHGVAIARYDSYNPGIRDELIFDKDTLEYIGSRSVATEDGGHVRAGEVLETSAVMERAVVDEAGRRP